MGQFVPDAGTSAMFAGSFTFSYVVSLLSYSRFVSSVHELHANDTHAVFGALLYLEITPRTRTTSMLRVPSPASVRSALPGGEPTSRDGGCSCLSLSSLCSSRCGISNQSGPSSSQLWWSLPALGSSSTRLATTTSSTDPMWCPAWEPSSLGKLTCLSFLR